MRIERVGIMTMAALALFSGSVSAADVTYRFGLSDARTNITFDSTTDFEQILGTTNKAVGTVVADFETGKGSVALSVPVSSMKTGIDMRDGHMRSPGWLDAEKYPDISFSSEDVKRSGDGVWVANGTFTMHGVSKPMTVEVEVKRIPAEVAAEVGMGDGEWLRISTAFEVRLSDFGVAVPERAAAKVSDTWKVAVLAFAGTGK